jgi:SAM-dependent methyltransferase
VQAEEYDRMYRLEDAYWWFVGRRRLAIGLLRRFLPGAEKRPKILDLGCGTGVIATELGQWSEVIGLDFSDKALAYCKSRGLQTLVQARGEHLPLREGTVDGILALDIFEHIEDDGAAFRESYRVLRPGGILVLSVPAFKALWGPHDVALMHFRRYRRSDVERRLQEVGFGIERASYSVFFLFPVVVLVRILEKMKRGEAKASLPPTPRWMNRALIKLQDMEASLIARFPLPWGSSVVAVARKPL